MPEQPLSERPLSERPVLEQPMSEKRGETLRQKQKRVAREAILRATADEIVERGMTELSLQVVAARAGVSTRTLYNYFENRDQLFKALVAWSDQLTADRGAWVVIEGLDGLPEAVPEVWRSWEEQGSIYQALVRIEAADSGPATEALREGRRARTDQLIRAVAERRPDLPDEELEEIATFLHALAGQAVWSRLRELSDLDSDRSGPVLTWAIQLMVEALDRGESPRQPAGGN